MCVTRAAKVLSLQGDTAKVRFLDSNAEGEIDVSFVVPRTNSYVEVFADHAIGLMSRSEAESKKKLLLELANAMKAGR